METGKVKYFNGNPGKLFGFIETPQGDVFFHLNDRYRSGSPHQLLPQKGDILVFCVVKSARRPRANRWAFKADWDAREEQGHLKEDSRATQSISAARYREYLARIEDLSAIMRPNIIHELTLKQLRDETAEFEAANPELATRLKAPVQ